MDFIIVYSAVDLGMSPLSLHDFSRLKILRNIQHTVYWGEPRFCKPISYCLRG